MSKISTYLEAVSLDDCTEAFAVPCGQAEKRMNIGVIYTTIAPHLGICADCINRYVMQR